MVGEAVGVGVAWFEFYIWHLAVGDGNVLEIMSKDVFIEKVVIDAAKIVG